MTAGSLNMQESSHARPMRVLVVDDCPTTRALLSRYLSGAGYEVNLAENGLRGLAIANQTQPDLVLSDVNMPGLDGLKLAQGLRSNAATREMPVILMTASDSAQDRQNCLAAGACQCVSKPVTRAALVERVQNVLARPR